MFNHVMVGTNDIDQAKTFYDALLGALGVEPGVIDQPGRCVYRGATGVFMVKVPLDGAPASNGNGSTVGFLAASEAEAEAWHAAGVANGGTTCEDPPGVRPNGAYLAYLRDPAGNKLCVVYR